VSWSLDARDLDLLAVQADERLLTAVGARRQVEVADPAIALLAALAREVDAKPIPADSTAGLRLVGQPIGVSRRANRRAALTGVAAAVAVLTIGGVAAAVGGTPVSSVINGTVGSVFNRDSGPSTAELVSAKLGDATAAWARGDIQQAKEILEDINAQVEGSDPGELPPDLVEQVKHLESLVGAAESLPTTPATTPLPSPIIPAGTSGGDASQSAEGEATHGIGKGRGTNQGQGQGKQDDGDTPTSEPTSTATPSDPTTESPAPSPSPTPSPSTDTKGHGPHGKGTKQDSSGSAAELGTRNDAPSAKGARDQLPGSQGQHKGGGHKPTADEPTEQAAAVSAP